MDFAKCKLCRAPFFSYGSRLCPECEGQVDKDFITVRDFIYDHPQHSGIEDIAAATGVSEKTIIYLLEEERIMASGALASSVGLSCSICGKSISAGTICESCKTSLAKDLGAAASALSEKKPVKTAPVAVRGGNRDFCPTTGFANKK